MGVSFGSLFKMERVQLVEHLYQIYPAMPRYANDPEESEVVKMYDFLLRRFQGFYGRAPSHFAKAPASPLLLGDDHPYVDCPYLAFNTTQDIVVAAVKTTSHKVRINNYQAALYSETELSSVPQQWTLSEKNDKDRFLNPFIRLLSTAAEVHKLKDFGGLDIMIYTGFIEDEFMGWKEALYSAFYAAVCSALSPKAAITIQQIQAAIKQVTLIDQEIVPRPQLTSDKYSHFSLHPKGQHPLQLPEGLSLVMAHSLTPLPRKLTRGKRFNLRRCQVLLGLQYLKSSAGTIKSIPSEMQQFIECSSEQLVAAIEENVPKGAVTAEEVEQSLQMTLIDILKEVPFANDVIDQNHHFFPRDRLLFLAKQQLLVEKVTSENLIETIKESRRNQEKYLGIGSEQIAMLEEVGRPLSFAQRIVGNGWGGSVVFVTERAKATKLVDQLIKGFYLSEENRVLLGDELEQYVQLVGAPATGLAVLDPSSQIWF